MSQQPQPIKIPKADIGIIYINLFIDFVNEFNEKYPNKASSKSFFTSQFGDYGNTLWKRYSKKDFGSWYLNLDNQNELQFLNAIWNGTPIANPEIANWKEIAERVLPGDDGFEMEDIRMLGESITGVSYWDLYDHCVLWIRRFVLHANNFSINDDSYKGNKFGNYPNWAKYFRKLEEGKQITIVNKLMFYK